MKLKYKLIITFSVILFVFSSAISILAGQTMRTTFQQISLESTKQMATVSLSYLDSKYPGDWRVEGDALYKGEVLINNNYEFVDKIKADTTHLATIFLQDTRVSTSVTNEKGERAVGTKASAEVVERVLKTGQSFEGDALVAGKPALTVYLPIKDAKGQIIGMWFMGLDKQVMQAESGKSINRMLAIQGTCLLLTIIIIYFVGTRLAKPLKAVTRYISIIAEGKFNADIPDTKLKDETGDILRALKTMQQSVRDIIHKVVLESTAIEGVLSGSVTNMGLLKGSMEEASATTEELSAGMEETAASMEEMNATSVEIEAAVGNIAKRAQSGSKAAEEIQQRANTLKQKAAQSKETALQMLGTSQSELKQAIDKSTAINKIQALTEGILQITSQTNMLALNAAIEASRAGDSGRGFAVVADEIRKLAEDSKTTANEIQAVTETVYAAVNNLVTSSERILGFINERVILDYDAQVATGEQYDRDARNVHQMMADFSNTSEQLLASISNMIIAIHEVSIAAGEGAEGSSNLASMAVQVTEKSNDVLIMAEKAKASVDALREFVGRFSV